MARIVDVHSTEWSDALELKANAFDYLILMKVAHSRRIYAQVAHMGHIAVELAIKAAYARRFLSAHPKGHDLSVIADYVFNPGQQGTFFDEIAVHSEMSLHYNSVKSAWRMQDRYLKRKIDRSTAIMYKTGYRELTKWILRTYV